MPKIRVHEVAKELGKSSREILDKLGEFDVAVKNHMSVVDDHDLKRIREAFGKKPDRVALPKAQSKQLPPPQPKQSPEKPVSNAAERRQDGSIWRGENIPATNQQRKPMDSIWKSANKPSQPQRQQRTQPVRPSLQMQPLAARESQLHVQPIPVPKAVEQQQPQPPISEQPQAEKIAIEKPADKPPIAVKKSVEKPVEKPIEKPRENIPAPAQPQPAPQRSEQPQTKPPVQRTEQPQANRPAHRPAQQQQYPPRTDRPQQGQGGQQGGSRPPYQQRGDRPQGGQGGQRPPYQQRSDRPQGAAGQGGQRPPYQRSDRPAGQGGQRQDGSRPPFQRSDRPGGGQGGQSRPGQPPRSGQSSRPGQPRAGALPKSPLDAAAQGKGQRAGQKRTANKSGPAARETLGRKPYGAQKSTGYKRQDISKPTAKTSYKSKQKPTKPMPELPPPSVIEEDGIKILRIGKGIQVKDLAERLALPSAEIIKILMKRGLMVTQNQEVDFYTATQVAEGFGAIVEKADEVDVLEQAFAHDEDDDSLSKPRPPIVVVMGHVDHGKTSLLDRIRQSAVTKSEAGGITQHIGAYTVAEHGKNITFLDTPGHEAFTAMRMRGARVTDIAILVVAADDGVMPQTIEAINHAKAAGVEIIVAINKMDKPSANPDRVKQELTEHGILVEEWGGEIIACPVSALKGDGIEHLLEMVLLVADMKELSANPNKKARGAVIEAFLDKTRGPVATVLVQSGTLNVGDPVVAGSAFGKIRAMIDDKGRKVKHAGPSIPVEILGLSEVPKAGDMFYSANSEKHARQVSESVVAQGREDMIKSSPKVSLNDLFDQIKAGNVKDLNIVIKADVQGSVEAVKNSLERLTNDEVRVRVLHGGVGAVTESDVMLASASNAIIIGFNVKLETNAKAVADAESVDIRFYSIIYNAIEDISAAMHGMLAPVYQEKIIGHAEIRQIFKASGIGNIGGSYVTDGKITRNSKIRLFRGEEKIFEGELSTLKRFKDDVKEVAAGYECGIVIHKFNDIVEGDKVEAYVMEEVVREKQ